MISNKSILIIDDNRITRLLLAKIFSKDYEVLQAGDGKTGFDLLLQDPSKICTILLNLNMPIMDGFKTLEQLRNIEECINVPVIDLTIFHKKAFASISKTNFSPW